MRVDDGVWPLEVNAWTPTDTRSILLSPGTLVNPLSQPVNQPLDWPISPTAAIAIVFVSAVAETGPAVAVVTDDAKAGEPCVGSAP